jgi:hypothetical protein
MEKNEMAKTPKKDHISKQIAKTTATIAKLTAEKDKLQASIDDPATDDAADAITQTELDDVNESLQEQTAKLARLNAQLTPSA